MSEDYLSNTVGIKFCDNADQAINISENQQQSSLTTDEALTNVLYDKQQLLAHKANNTFQELHKTLENEQTKLMELEKRRKLLQEEMLLLKAEIEKERLSFNSKIVQSVTENLSILNNSSTGKDDTS